jgi:hypothetical protein
MGADDRQLHIWLPGYHFTPSALSSPYAHINM